MRFNTLCCTALLFFLVGCTRLGGEYQREDLPPGAPDPAAVLAELAANESAIGEFRAAGEFSLQSPDIAGVQVLRQSTIHFRHPAELHVIGRKYTSVVMRLTCSENAFVLEFPTEKEYIHRESGEYIPELDTQVTPAWIAREMFRPMAWEEIPPQRIRMVDYDEVAQRMVLEILGENNRGQVVRRLELAGPPWVIRKSELFDGGGAQLAVTEKSDYRNVDGMLFPAEVRTQFPQTGAEMRISMRKIFLNDPAENALFDLQAALLRLNSEKYRQVNAYEEITAAP